MIAKQDTIPFCLLKRRSRLFNQIYTAAFGDRMEINMKNKILSVVFVSLLMAITAFALNSCGSDHEHSYGQWVTVTEATCTSGGERTRSCSCGDAVTEPVGKLGHDETTYRKDATCTESGYEFYTTCSRCDYISSKEIPAAGHSLVHTEAKAPTCFEVGFKAYDACENCNYSTYEEIPMAAHTLSHIDAVAASCNADGTAEHWHCTVCEKNFSDESADSEIEDLSVPAAGHIYYNAACTVCAEEQKVSEGLSFTLSDSEENYILTGIGTCTDTSILIPALYNGKYVVSIGNDAFMNCTSLLDVTIPEYVTSIGSNAFSGCRYLKSVTIGSRVSSIGDSAFEGCSSLYRAALTDSVKTIGDKAFFNCSALTSLSIPKSVESLKNNSFSGCSSLESIYADTENGVYNSIGNCLIERNTNTLVLGCKTSVIPSSVTTIGVRAFEGCNAMTSITIPDTITTIKPNAFLNCTSLKEVRITDIAAWCKIDFDSNADTNPLYYAKDLYINDVLAEEIVLPNTVDAVSVNSFRGCTSLTSITIPDSAAYVGKNAFLGCTSLVTVKIGNGVKDIGEYAFSGCKALADITMGSALESIGDYAFVGCSVLESLDLGENVSSVGQYAFNNCSSLVNINMYESVTSIAETAFENCTALQYTNDNGALYLGNQTNPYVALIKMDAPITSYAIQEGTVIIADGAFRGNTALQSVTVPESVSSFGKSAFYECSALTEITIPKAVTYIGTSCFCYCTALTSINYNAEAVADFGDHNYVFGYVGKDGTGTVLTIGKDVKIIPARFLSNYEQGENTKITSIVFEEGSVCESFGDNAFNTCAHITEFIIPDSVTSIGKSAFGYYCSNLTSITIGKGVKTIGENAFGNIGSLKYVTFNATAADDSNYITAPFISSGDKSGGITVTVGANVTKIPECLFLKSKVISVVFESGSVCESIGDRAFYDDFSGSLKEINIPKSVAYIDFYALYNCEVLETIAYEGTMDEWRAVEKHEYWNIGTGDYIVVCSDGRLSKDGTQIIN